MKRLLTMVIVVMLGFCFVATVNASQKFEVNEELPCEHLITTYVTGEVKVIARIKSDKLSDIFGDILETKVKLQNVVISDNTGYEYDLKHDDTYLKYRVAYNDVYTKQFNWPIVEGGMFFVTVEYTITLGEVSNVSIFNIWVDHGSNECH